MTERPQRIQRKRTKGWRAPKGAIYVGRPSIWGNPFPFGPTAHYKTRAESVDAYRRSAELGLRQIPIWPEMLARLRGHDLMCWCPLTSPCHADVLIELANR